MPHGDRELRRDKRVAFATRTEIVSPSDAGRRIENASTIDLSESGVRVRMPGGIEPGQVIDIYLNKCPEKCRVVWTGPSSSNKDMVAGLEFINPLPDPRHPPTPPFSRFEPIN